MTASVAALRRCRKICQFTRLPVLLILLLIAGNSLAFDIGNKSLFGGNGNNGFLPVDEALPFSYSTDSGAVILNWNITPEHYLYQGRIKVTPVTEGVTTGQISYSLAGKNIEDEYFGAVTVFYDPIEARVPVTLPAGVTEAHLKVTYQGCAN
ncbi:MAG TPA: protein-disulfide reductase DsbD domain-containing protein, partial [Marinobacter sp.]|nr:protein-disulfide reductase DsbD domain-containing protein [Marinobacter sp.]